MRVGELVATGQGIGRVGNTTNGKYPGMGAHLHHVTSTLPWPKGYGRGSFDPVIAFARIGVVFEPRGGRRGRFMQGPSCDFATPRLGNIDTTVGTDYELAGRIGRLGVDPSPGEDEYEPPPEAFTEEYEVSDLARITPMLLGLGALGLGAVLLGSVIAGMRRQ